MKYLTNSGLSYFLNKIKAYLTSSTYLNSIGIFPNNDNSVDLGASSKNIKMIYTKGITINGTQFLPSDYATLSGLSTVATSGSYNDLSNKPTIPTVNNATLTIQKNGTNVATFTSNSNTDVTANISVPTKTSELTNDSGFLTSHQDLSGYVPRSGGAVMNGTTFNRTVNDSSVTLCGGTDWDGGASITLSGKDRTNDNGDVIIRAKDNSNVSDFVLRPNGTATWGNKNLAMQEDVVPRSGGGVMTGLELGRVDNGNQLRLCGGTSLGDGATVIAYGKNISTPQLRGAIRIALADDSNEKYMDLSPDGTWTWDGTACQILSDQRLKQQIAEIDDKLLDAWEDVELSQFKYNDAVDQKGDNARLHTGYVVQQIDEACQKHNIDISEYGLYCHEEYPEETEEVEVEQADGTKTKETKVIREANEHYSLRYTETLVVECAYLRKQIKELKERLEKLEAK